MRSAKTMFQKFFLRRCFLIPHILGVFIVGYSVFAPSAFGQACSLPNHYESAGCLSDGTLDCREYYQVFGSTRCHWESRSVHASYCSSQDWSCTPPEEPTEPTEPTDWIRIRASVDTFLKAKPLQSSSLSGGQKCFIRAGTTIAYVTGSRETAGSNHDKVTLKFNSIEPFCPMTLTNSTVFVFRDHWN